ncbi:MAG: aminotransferase class I/II-fold pyridoxal phosphate-dependent enzyme [Bacteroidales bacterium]|nr:aminotransferase class I/II-fold pyridoxal phosphate-dependent enzyme [Bacteroidales bacterium]
MIRESVLQKKFVSYTAPQEVMKAGIYPYFRVLESPQEPEVIYKGKKLLMFGSNSYLGLTNHPRIKEAAIKAIQKYGTGCAGSRFLNGTIDLHIELEKRLAEFVHMEDALVFSTGFLTNLGVISSITGRHDYLIIDDSDHASIIEGTRLSFSKVLKYKHNNVESLKNILEDLPPEAVKLIITDGVFSMEGDIAPLPEIVELTKKYNAAVLVDDAHGLGVLGKNGAGTVNHFNLDGQVDLIMGTFSKSLATVGGFIAASKEVINYLKHNARSLIFSASLPPASTAAVIEALNVLRDEPERIQKLWDNTHYARKLLNEAGFDTGNSQTPIIPIYVRNDHLTFTFTTLLAEEGVFVNPVISPAVKPSDSLIRFSIMATHEKHHIDQAVEKLVKVAKKLNNILKK